jgi:hypothetical protein
MELAMISLLKLALVSLLGLLMVSSWFLLVLFLSLAMEALMPELSVYMQ